MKKLLIAGLLLLSSITFSWVLEADNTMKVITQKSYTEGGNVSLVKHEGKMKLIIVNRRVDKFTKSEVALAGVRVDGGKQHYLAGVAVKNSNMVVIELDEDKINTIIPILKQGNIAIIAVASDSFEPSAGSYSLKGFSKAFSNLN